MANTQNPNTNTKTPGQAGQTGQGNRPAQTPDVSKQDKTQMDDINRSGRPTYPQEQK